MLPTTAVECFTQHQHCKTKLFFIKNIINRQWLLHIIFLVVIYKFVRNRMISFLFFSIQILSGSELPADIISETNELLIILETDLSGIRTGFLATHQQICKYIRVFLHWWKLGWLYKQGFEISTFTQNSICTKN